MKTVLSIAALFSALTLAAVAGAQTTPSGVAVPPGTQNRPGAVQPCTTDPGGMPTTQATADGGCTAMAPGFAGVELPSRKEQEHPVTAVIRVAAVIEKPAAFPYPVDFSPIGEATMVKAELPRLTACLAVGRGWSRRSGKATSTTCLDHKGQVIAYQECKAAVDATPISCSAISPKGEEIAVAAIARP